MNEKNVGGRESSERVPNFWYCCNAFRFRPPRRPQQIIDHPAVEKHRREREYFHLYHTTADKDGLESIRALHMQLDDDNDGSIEPSETGDFIRGDLKKVHQIFQFFFPI